MTTKKILYALLLAWLMPGFLLAQNESPRFYHLLIGTYTNATSKGIYVYQFDTKTGTVTYEQVAAGVKDPSYLTVSADNRFVYAVNESHNPVGDSVSAFKFDSRSGKLTYINKLSTYGTDPCYVSVDKNNRNLFVANYSSGSLIAYSLNRDGSIADTLQTIHHSGGSVDTTRQKTAHVHAVVLSPDQKYLFADDLGTDKVYQYVYQPNNKQPLTPAAQPTVAVRPGSGPRHLVFSADAKHAYLTQEMGALVTAFNYADEKLNPIQTIAMESSDFKGQNGAADLHLSSDGNFLYASNRGQANDLIVYKVNKTSGQLSFVERQSCLGNGPRNFAIDPSGNFLLVANQNSNDIYTFSINKTTGKLTRTGSKLELSHPVYLKFVPIK
ncbi:lactonase family protein [Mucilaginibacter arboris]|uniref:Beta-propeller fold lactonase family protein n=1 Tax=Mucilaginibacter arboris TaxID=2682090 RepID=A0A7K1SW44_9SPHI|nr:lactonase family protein [Mucilaginibacter arboris]MVN21513.1 beta-propeller fold lactonase family protein [Mucilaginibacter arboris]